MKNTRSSLLVLAERQMQERRLEDAIRSFRLYLRGNPNDLRALLQVGICHLLNRSEGEFLKVHQKVRTVAARIRRLPDAIARMWDVYGSLAAKVVAATVVIGALALPGLAQQARPLYAAPPYRPTPAQPSPSSSARPAKPTPKPGNARIKPSPRPSPRPSSKPSSRPSPRPSVTPTASPASSVSPDRPMLTKYGGPRFNPDGR